MRLIDIEDVALLKTVTDGGLSAKALWRRINNQPTVDAEPVRHGQWIDRNGAIVAPFWERYECSECGARSDNSNYCPNCGARMMEERDSDHAEEEIL